MSLRGKRILITSGPTWVPIDGVRVIGNVSTGELGSRLARQLKARGARVTMLEGPVLNSRPPAGVTVKKFVYFDELLDLLKAEVQTSYDSVIHAAAVSDYRLKRTSARKIRSDLGSWELTLVPTVKIIDHIKRWAPDTVLVGFKLESTVHEAMARRQAARLVQRAGCDLVLVNSVSKGYQGFLVDPGEGRILRVGSRDEAARGLVNLLKDKL